MFYGAGGSLFRPDPSDQADTTRVSCEKTHSQRPSRRARTSVARSRVVKPCPMNCPLIAGLPTYGGLAGYDLEIIATGIPESVDERLLAHRAHQIEVLAAALRRAGVPSGVHRRSRLPPHTSRASNSQAKHSLSSSIAPERCDRLRSVASCSGGRIGPGRRR
jgi:hypothetical protein